MFNNSASTIDLRTLSGAQAVMAYRGGGLFPVLVTTAPGTLIAAVRGGAGHLGVGGRMEVIRSLDQGKSWSPPVVVADSDRDDRNPALGVSTQGTLILAYQCQGNYDSAGNYVEGEANDASRVEAMVTRSLDDGLSWERPKPLGVPTLTQASPFGKIVALADGTLLMALYDADSWLVRSHDEGQSWGDPSRIGKVMSETALLALPNGDLLAVMRGSGNGDPLFTTHSSDGGYHWSEPLQITQARQHPADLLQLSNGDILLTYGNRNPPYRIEGRISQDGGHSWLDPLLLFSAPLYGYTVDAPRPNDLGYPSNALCNGHGVTLYYYNPSMQPFVRTESGLEKAQNPALYEVQNYCAVALLWDEDQLIEILKNRGENDAD